MTKLEFIIAKMEKANASGAFSLEESRSIANCLDAMKKDEQVTKELVEENKRLNEEVDKANEAADALLKDASKPKKK